MSFSVAFLTVLCFVYTSGDKECGLQWCPSQRVAGGRPAKEGAWPWMVGITLRQKKRISSDCSGFMISDQHVITAAHCFDTQKNPNITIVRVGVTEIRKSVPYRVKRIEIPKEYVIGEIDHDIAIMKLTCPVLLPSVSPICLPSGELTKRHFVGVNASLAGWGRVKPDGMSQDRLRQLESMPVIDNKSCKEMYSNLTSSGIKENHICAGFLEGGKDGCQGDSGAPLMYYYDRRWYAIGVTSFGEGCGKKGYAAVYTRVTSYLDWIKRIYRLI